MISERRMFILFTYGYTGGTVEDLKGFIRDGALVMDVRYSPNSRVSQWRKEHLEAVLGEKYLWVSALGNVNYRRCGPISIPHLHAGLRILNSHLEEAPVVILCACADHEACHRNTVAQAARRVIGCEVRHLKPGERIGG